MQIGLVVAGGLTVLTAIAHSVLGERYILVRLFRRADLPRLFGSDWFTRRTLRFAWHLTSVAWCGFGALLLVLAPGRVLDPVPILRVIAVTFLCGAALTAFSTRGKHLAWPVFLAIAALAWLAT